MAGSVSRRDFARLFAVGGSAALFSDPAWAREYQQGNGAAPAIGGTGEAYWKSVRAQFVMPPELGVLNAANLCPASRPVLEALRRETDSVDKDPSAQNRARLNGEKENLRKTLAAFLRVTPEEIVITRNTSEANNMVSSGLDLKAGDEVIVFQDNHPSNLTAWKEKGKRFGFTVIEIPQVNPHPGMEHYIDAYKKAAPLAPDGEAYLNLARVLWQEDRIPEAKEAARQAVAKGVKKPDDAKKILALPGK